MIFPTALAVSTLSLRGEIRPPLQRRSWFPELALEQLPEGIEDISKAASVCRHKFSAISDINGEAAEQVRHRDSSRWRPCGRDALDVADESAWKAAIDTILSAHKRLDVLVNNAGIGC